MTIGAHSDNGSPLSPRWRNLLHAPVPLGVEEASAWEEDIGTRLVTYADDLVILCLEGNAEARCIASLATIIGLRSDSERGQRTTTVCKVARKASFVLLWAQFGRYVLSTRCQPALASATSKKSSNAHGRKGPCADLVDRREHLAMRPQAICELNRALAGWPTTFQCPVPHHFPSLSRARLAYTSLPVAPVGTWAFQHIGSESQHTGAAVTYPTSSSHIYRVLVVLVRTAGRPSAWPGPSLVKA